MRKIFKDTKFINVIEEFEKCLDLDKELHDKDSYHNLKYSILKLKEHLEKQKEYDGFDIPFKRYANEFNYFYDYNKERSPYDVMLMSELNNVFNLYVWRSEYNQTDIAMEKITKLVTNPEEDIEDYENLYEYNYFKEKDKYISGILSRTINGDLLKCKVPENNTLITYNPITDKEIEFKSGEEFFIFARKGTFSMLSKNQGNKVIDENGNELRYKGVGGLIFPKDDIVTKENIRVSCKSSVEDIMNFKSSYYINDITNIEIPLNWIKQRFISITLNKNKHYVPLSIGHSNNSIQDFLSTKKNKNKDLELLTKLYNDKELTTEEAKYLIESDFDFCHIMNTFSDEIKDFILKEKRFSNNEEIYKRLNLQTNDNTDEIFFNTGVSLKYMKNINYNPSENSIKKHLERNGLELQHVDNQTKEMCTIAVKSKGTALRFVKEQTLAICKEAVLKDQKAIKYVDKKFLNSVMTSAIKISKIKRKV